MNIHFDFFRVNPADSSCCRTKSKCWRWSVSLVPETKMSSIYYTPTFCISLNRFSIVRWNIDGEDEIPKGSISNWNSPLSGFTVVYFLESLSNNNWRYAWLRSSLENTVRPDRTEKRSSTWEVSGINALLTVTLQSPHNYANWANIFYDRNNWSCPCGMFDRGEYLKILYSLEFVFNFLF